MVTKAITFNDERRHESIVLHWWTIYNEQTQNQANKLEYWKELESSEYLTILGPTSSVCEMEKFNNV